MGCGSSTPAVVLVDGEKVKSAVDKKLAMHLSAILGIPSNHPSIEMYVERLTSEGCETPKMFDLFTLDELKEPPFCFKRGHLKMVAHARDEEAKETGGGGHSRARATLTLEPRPDSSTRGKCSVCGIDVLDSQPRLKDPKTGFYQHQDCRASNAREVAIADATAKATAALLMYRPSTAATEAAEAEVAATMTTADAARTAMIADAEKRAEAALAQGQKDAEKIAAVPTAYTTANSEAADADCETASALSRSNKSLQSSAALLAPPPPSGPKTNQPLLPEGKHAFLSYQWDVQEQVKQIKALLNERRIKCWMDIDGGMKTDIYDTMAAGVQGAACVICFMTQAYQDSANCKLELKFAQQSGVPIIPVMMQANFTAKGWLGILTSGSIWTPMHDRASVPDGINTLIELAQHLVPGMHGVDDGSDAASEVSEGTESFDVGAWGADMFSLDEMREELQRLREATAPGPLRKSTTGTSLCPLPAMVPTLPRGLFVTAAMQSVLDAVVSDTSPPQIGFCGMGGIGKTTVSCWVTRSDAVRTKFGTVAWVTLGQTPVLDSCITLVYQQLTGSHALPDGATMAQKHEFLHDALLNRSVLLILDDCWDAEVAKHFNWIDQSTNSKMLISSRVRDVLDGGDIIDVAVPSKSDAVKMLLSTAGMDVAALQERDEVAHIVELVKRLPLTIGVAGKLIRQLAHGSSMSATSDWTDVMTFLEDEMNDPEGSLSIEESVIRASIKAIPKKIREQVTQLFRGFALAPEDTIVPLPVLGMIYDACSVPSDSRQSFSSDAGCMYSDVRNSLKKTSSPHAVVGAEPLSRLQTRRYLKVLIDRSLVLGTVDRPQLHDVMLDYVQKGLADDVCRAAQRQLVELLRKADRSPSTVTGNYILNCVQHHINKSYTAVWEKGPQAVSWLEDHVHGVQDTIASSTASILPAEQMAKDAEDTGAWWKAALRWNALGLMKKNKLGGNFAGAAYFKRAVAASAKEVVGSEGSGDKVTRFDIDSFELHVLNFVLKSWDPADLAKYGPRMQKALATKAGASHTLMAVAAGMALDWFPAILSGNEQAHTDEIWKLGKLILDMLDETTGAYAHSTERDRRVAQTILAWLIRFGGDAIVNSPGFRWDLFAINGDMFVDCYNVYTYEEHHSAQVDILSGDTMAMCSATQWLLALQYGRIEDARKMMEDNLVLKPRVTHPASAGYVLAVCWTAVLDPYVYHMFGISHLCRPLFDILGLTFENIAERFDTITKPAQGAFYTAMEHKGSGGGLFSLKRIIWQVKTLFVLTMGVPQPKAAAWLRTLPDNEDFSACSMTMPTHDHGAVHSLTQTCWIALAHEKVGLFEGAIRFANLQVEQDMLKGGTPLIKWPQVIAWACKGRVLAKLGRQDEALAAFQAAIAVSKESYSLMAAFAYRELANYPAGGDAAVQANVDLEAKLKTFEGRMTRDEFDGLTIGPGTILGS